MAETPKAPSGTARSPAEDRQDARVVLANRAAQASSTSRDEPAHVLQIVEEHIEVAKRRALIGTVRVGTRTETVEEIADVELDRYRIEVTRVPVGRVVDVAPVARAEGDTTVIPVVEERLVLVKQLFLVEEVHVRHVRERELVREPVTLRRQRAVVERLGPEGGTVPGRADEGSDPHAPDPD